MRHFWMAILALALAWPSLGCNSVTEDNLNKWMNTQRGPDKIVGALKDDGVDVGLRAVAARNLIRMEKWSEVKAFLEDAPTDKRVPLIKALAPRLWEDARISDEMQVPSPVQTNAKDALYELRGYTDDAGREAIDGYLIEWLTGYYEGRARSGRVGGHQIVRAIGARAAEGLLEQGRSIVAAPPDKDGSYQRVGDNLLYGLALSGSEKAVGFVLDLAASESKDKTLQDRAMASLHNAYVKPVGVEPADAKALKPHSTRLAEIIKNPDLPGAVRNDAILLVASMGMPECLPIFVELVSYPAQTESVRWIGVQQGIRCGELDAIVPVAEALPPGAAYRQEVLKKYFWEEVMKLSPRAAIAERAVTLLGSASPAAKVTGIELLGLLKLRGRAAQDAEKIEKLSGDQTLLKGWWGTGKGAAGKRAPTVGQRAAAVAKELKLAGR